MALQKERNYGIDLLRMVSMYMVCILHVLNQGGALSGIRINSGQYLIGWFLEYAALASVNLYALISGYVGVRSKCRASNLAVLWLQVFLYSFGIALALAFLRPGWCSGRALIGYAFPVLTVKYWYFTAYVCLFLFMPVLNAGMHALSKRALQYTVIAMLLVFSVATSAAKEATFSPFNLASGYSGLWLMILYVVGGYIGKYGLWERVSKPALLGVFFCCASAALGLRCAVREISLTASGAPYYLKFLSSYYSPLLVLASVALLLFFARLKCGNIAKRLIAFWSPAAFGVYIIHVHPLIWDHLMKDRFTFISNHSPLVYGGLILLSALIIFLACSIVDLLRDLFFKLIRVKQGFRALERRLFKEKEKIGNRN